MSDKPKDIWVFVEHCEGVPVDVTYEMLQDARKLADTLKQKVVALVLGGPALPDFSRRLAEYGADKVFVGRYKGLVSSESGILLQVLSAVCQELVPGNLILPATPGGQDLAARLAARLDVGLVSHCLRFTIGSDDVVQGVKESHGGKVYSTLACCGLRPHLFTFKPGSVGVGSPNKQRTAEVFDLPLFPVDVDCYTPRTLEFFPADPRTVDLIEADMIVAGGAGVGTQEMFAVLQELADTIGASIGGTRPAVDEEWIPFERQIGQTGKIVSPRLYLAAGISGATLHAMGIKGSENIIAINTDKNAPIFNLSHCSAVGDLIEVLPLLLKKIKDHQRAGSHDLIPA